MNRIKQFRLAKGFSLDDLTQAMGGIVTKQAISKYERTLSTPSAPVLNQLARALGVKALQLLSEPSVSVRFVAYRKRKTFPKKEQNTLQAVVTQKLEERTRLQEYCFSSTQFDLAIEQIPVANEHDAERAAEQIREHWHLGLDPIANLTAILEDHLVHVIQVEAPERFDGISAVAEDAHGNPKAAAVVSRFGCPGGRQRLNLAHELGHLVMKPSQAVNEERAAFRFAGAFLAPRPTIEREVGTRRSSVRIEELLIFKQRFGMSVQALLMRLSDLQIISPTTFKWAWIHLSKLNWRKQEPLPLQPEKPEWLRQAALRCFAEGFITQEEAERLADQQLDQREAPGSLRRRAFLKLPIEERRRILEHQAEQIQKHYEQNQSWRDVQGGDVLDYE
jgi:transcriptional regulator with XRE-family HTH domain